MALFKEKESNLRATMEQNFIIIRQLEKLNKLLKNSTNYSTSKAEKREARKSLFFNVKSKV